MSCCTCGSGCQSGCGCRVIVLPDNPVDGYAMVNINTLGIGVYDSTEGTTFQMRGIYSDSASLIVTLDAANAAIKLTFDVSSIVVDIPDATTTQRGVLETATDAEAIAKAANNKIVTPSNFAAMASSATFAGLVELATDAETQAGVSTTLAVTPAGLASVTATFQGTRTFADGVARVAAVPDFDGQFGFQLDADTAWAASGTGAGDFDLALLTLNTTNNQLDSATTINLNTQTFTLALGDFTVFDTTTVFDDGSVTIGNAFATDFDFGANTNLKIGGVQVPAQSVLTTSLAGTPSSLLLNQFLSDQNIQLGWGVPSGTLARTTFATYAGQNISNPPTEAEVQAIDDALVIVSRRLAALITDVLARLLPTTP